MDLMAFLRYVTEHNQQVIGALVVVIIVTSILLMMRTISQDKNAPQTAKSGKGSDLDLGAIEAAFKRVLVAQGGATVGGSGATSSGSGKGPEKGAAETSDRDTKIQELAREIDRLTAELAGQSAASGFGGTSSAATAGASAGTTGVSNLDVDALHSKIAELEGKLTEYEIIEDDIADLSRFKEENTELRSELEALKQNTAAMAPGAALKSSSPVTPDSAPDFVTTPNADAIAEEMFGSSADAPQATPDQLNDQTPEPVFKVVGSPDAPAPAAVKQPPIAAPAVAVEKAADKKPAEELVLNESESSLEIQIATKPEASRVADGASVLEDSLDTEKMLSEVASLSELEVSDDNALSDQLDTDKLIAEVDTMAAGAPVAPIAAQQVATQQVTTPPVQPVAIPPPVLAAESVSAPPPAPPLASLLDQGMPVLEDDLLAEFKESTDGGQG
jgi:hypothetical protein